MMGKRKRKTLRIMKYSSRKNKVKTVAGSTCRGKTMKSMKNRMTHVETWKTDRQNRKWKRLPGTKRRMVRRRTWIRRKLLSQK